MDYATLNALYGAAIIWAAIVIPLGLCMIVWISLCNLFDR